MKILQTTYFKKAIKKLHPNQRKDLDKAIIELSECPFLGETKNGDLEGVRVYKFSMVKQLTLLAYQYHGGTITLTLIMFGPHENFYRDLKH